MVEEEEEEGLQGSDTRIINDIMKVYSPMSAYSETRKIVGVTTMACRGSQTGKKIDRQQSGNQHDQPNQSSIIASFPFPHSCCWAHHHLAREALDALLLLLEVLEDNNMSLLLRASAASAGRGNSFRITNIVSPLFSSFSCRKLI